MGKSSAEEFWAKRSFIAIEIYDTWRNSQKFKDPREFEKMKNKRCGWRGTGKKARGIFEPQELSEGKNIEREAERIWCEEHAASAAASSSAESTNPRVSATPCQSFESAPPFLTNCPFECQFTRVLESRSPSRSFCARQTRVRHIATQDARVKIITWIHPNA